MTTSSTAPPAPVTLTEAGLTFSNDHEPGIRRMMKGKKAAVSLEEGRLAQTLVETATADKLDFSKYKDIFTAKVEKLLASKTPRAAKKQKVEAAVDDSDAPIINLMDALKQSLEHAKKKMPHVNVGSKRKGKSRRTG